MTKALTERQILILQALQAFINQHGYAPSVRELAQMCNIKSPQGVTRHLEALEKKGCIERGSKARSLRVLLSLSDAEKPDFGGFVSQKPNSIAKQASGNFEEESGLILKPRASDFALIPIVGQVAAGQPIAAVQNIEDYLPVSPQMLSSTPDSFFLRVRGHSMAEGIQPRDLILVTPHLRPERADIVVAMIDDEATVKRYYPEKDRIILRPDNPDYQDIVVTGELQIVGKVTALIRHL